ncbi:MAG: hypothetical protein RR612_11835, partial [Oscillospiraceae bacterium]
MNILKDNVVVPGGAGIIVTNNQNILEKLRSQGVGNYTVEVRAEGDASLYAPSDFARAAKGIVIAQLNTPTDLIWKTATAEWSAVQNAAKYSVQLYNAGIASGAPIEVAKETLTHDFTLQTANPGSYTFKVTAISTGLIINSAESVASAPYYVGLQLQCTDNGIISKNNNTGVTISVTDADLLKIKSIAFASADQDKDKIVVANTGLVSLKAGYIPQKDTVALVDVTITYTL